MAIAMGLAALHALHFISFIALAIIAILFLLVLFEPPLRYRVKAPGEALDSEAYLDVIAALVDAQPRRHSSVQLLSDGKNFYETELAAMRQSSRSIHIEAFIFHSSPIADRFLDTLIERATDGVEVKVVVDAVGSLMTRDHYFDRLRQAGGQVRWYQPLRLSTFKRFNNRTHRELIIIDGRIGFIGGAGIAAQWDAGIRGKPPWRDMMCRVEGDLVSGLQTAFAENWLESSGEILAASENYLDHTNDSARHTSGLVIIGAPTAGRSTRNRVLFQTLIASARKTISVHSPYFLPDHSVIEELVRAVSERGVLVRVIVPGKFNNHGTARLASRRRYGPLIEAGVEIYEYQPGMIHTKTMSVDDLWAVLGSTNFDSRSFDLNDEVNLAAVDADLVASLQQEFLVDLSRSRRITYEEWLQRGLVERVAAATIGRLLERQE